MNTVDLGDRTKIYKDYYDIQKDLSRMILERDPSVGVEL